MAKKSTSEFAITNLQVFAEEEESTYRQACEPPQISLHRLLRDRSKPLPASTRLRRAPAERPADLLSLVASLFHVVKYLEAVTRVTRAAGGCGETRRTANLVASLFSSGWFHDIAGC
jgi:hypothetical protein